MDVGIINNGILPVKIKNIDYSIELDSTKEILSEGVIKVSKLSPKEQNKFRMDATVRWKPGLETISGMISKGETNVTIYGDVHVLYLGIIGFSIPFSEKRDIEPMLKAAIGNKINDFVKGIFG
jgi:LEA14-like dessication related protein